MFKLKSFLFTCFICLVFQSPLVMSKGKGNNTLISLQNIITVAKKNGDFTDPVTANKSISDASFFNRYLIEIGPGEYILSERLVMQPYVSITGSGQELTRLAGTFASGFADQDAAVVQMANDTKLSSLSVDNGTGTGSWHIGIYTEFLYDTAEIINVTSEARGGLARAGIYNYGGEPTMTNVIGKGTSTGGTDHYGIVNKGASPQMTDVTGDGRNSTTVNVGIYNTDGSSPTMNNITAISFGGNITYAVFNNNSSNPIMMNVVADASFGTGKTYGVVNKGSSPTMMNVLTTGHANSGSAAGGILNILGATPILINVEASGDGGVNNYGVYSATGSPAIIRRSSLSGSPALYMNDVGSAAKVSQSSIIGGVNEGYASCVASDNGEGTLLSSTCQ